MTFSLSLSSLSSPHTPPTTPTPTTSNSKSKNHAGCDPNNEDGKGWSAVHYAAEYGRAETLHVLSEACGKDIEFKVDLPDKRGWTPLMCAAGNGHVSVIKALKAIGADLNKQNDEGRTALFWAAARGETDMLRML